MAAKRVKKVSKVGRVVTVGSVKPRRSGGYGAAKLSGSYRAPRRGC
jgi:hypothetical protein